MNQSPLPVACIRLTRPDKLTVPLEGLPIDYLDNRAALFASVTHDDARRVARLFDPEKLTFVVVGNPADLTPPGPGRTTLLSCFLDTGGLSDHSGTSIRLCASSLRNGCLD